MKPLSYVCIGGPLDGQRSDNYGTMLASLVRRDDSAYGFDRVEYILRRFVLPSSGQPARVSCYVFEGMSMPDALARLSSIRFEPSDFDPNHDEDSAETMTPAERIRFWKAIVADPVHAKVFADALDESGERRYADAWRAFGPEIAAKAAAKLLVRWPDGLERKPYSIEIRRSQVKGEIDVPNVRWKFDVEIVEGE